LRSHNVSPCPIPLADNPLRQRAYTKEGSLILVIRKATGSKAKVERSSASWGTSLFLFLVVGKESQVHTYTLNARSAKNLR
jgi:hypothetical protein